METQHPPSSMHSPGGLLHVSVHGGVRLGSPAHTGVHQPENPNRMLHEATEARDRAHTSCRTRDAKQPWPPLVPWRPVLRGAGAETCSHTGEAKLAPVLAQS